MWETDIGRPAVPGQPEQKKKKKKKKFERCYLNRKKLGVVVRTCYPTYARKPKIEGLCSRLT
jgi:hypothetical protein